MLASTQAGITAKLGRAPTRAIRNHMRVEAFIDEMSTATVELIKAIRTMIQPEPHTRLAMMNPGLSLAFTNEVVWWMPQPTERPHAQTTRKTPMMMIERMTPRPTVARGLAVSSAIGAAASHPVNAKIANVMPR